ncbi:MAG TPA: hypothetical protein VGH54_11460 [Mycobacterium sp.]|uniref:hypothetical protein n=1 Tax=Mycobacterium sp. TaxID=1785 RepID=UPI002F3F3C93
MACDSPVRECFEWHVLPRLGRYAHRKLDDGSDDKLSVRTLCPAHDDREASLSISIGDKQRIVWQCFAGCNPVRVRAALNIAGIPLACLPLAGKQREDLLDLLRAILTGDSADHGEVRLLALVALEGYASLPRGTELERIAGLGSIGRATAYRARRAAPGVKTANPSTYSSGEKPVKPRRSGPSGKVPS